MECHLWFWKKKPKSFTFQLIDTLASKKLSPLSLFVLFEKRQLSKAYKKFPVPYEKKYRL